MAALEKLESWLEEPGYQVPEVKEWTAKLGAAAPEVVALGTFLGRLVRVSQELTYTAQQMETLRTKLAGYFAKKDAMTVADFRELTGASRKYGVPLLEHCDRVGWTVRSGDVRKRGAIPESSR
jgi:selenocysteine-specific elongation factor